MSESGAEKSYSSVRLRRPERRQVAMSIQCRDDLVGAGHAVRLVQAVAEKLDLGRFHEPIEARKGSAGRDATDPEFPVSPWLYACIRGIGSARELARRCEGSAAFRWLCGGVTVNHRLLLDFRTDHGAALDQLFTQVIASLVAKDVVKVSRVSQDGVRVSAGAASLRREERLENLLQKARQHVEQLRQQVDSPEHASLSAWQRAARKRAAAEKLERLEPAVAQLPELKLRQAAAVRQAGQGESGEKIGARQPRAGATDPEARRMASEEEKEIYKERAATSETVNADRRSYRGLSQFTVRGLNKIKCVALWCAPAYNLMRFGYALPAQAGKKGAQPAHQRPRQTECRLPGLDAFNLEHFAKPSIKPTCAKTTTDEFSRSL